MNIYLIGIGGASAQYLVALARAEGHQVSGSDHVQSENTAVLVRSRVSVTIPHNAAAINPAIGEVWYSAAITETSPGFAELKAARALGIPTISFAVAAARYFNRATTRVAIAGTHGKSTTTAMVGWILQKAGYHPTVALGAAVHAWRGGVLVGGGDVFVIEADEYAERFLNYEPTHAVVTSIEPDHFDTYPTESALELGFKRFIDKIEDTLVGNGNDRRIRSVAADFAGRIMWYGLNDDPTGLDLQIAFKAEQAILMPLNIPLQLQIPGQFNVLNAVAAITVCSRLGVPFKRGIEALADFPGVARRFEYVGKLADDVLIYDDYGHHPTEIAATLEAARQKFPKYSILLIHQPHQAGRLAHLFDETVASLSKADQVILLPVYQVEGRENPADVASATSEKLAVAVQAKGGLAEVAGSYEIAAEKARTQLKPKTLILTMGATDVWKVGKLLLRG